MVPSMFRFRITSSKKWHQWNPLQHMENSMRILCEHDNHIEMSYWEVFTFLQTVLSRKKSSPINGIENIFHEKKVTKETSSMGVAHLFFNFVEFGAATWWWKKRNPLNNSCETFKGILEQWWSRWNLSNFFKLKLFKRSLLCQLYVPLFIQIDIFYIPKI